MPSFAFYNFNLETVTVGGTKNDEPVTIGSKAFFDCANLKKLNCFGNLTFIDNNAFAYTALESVDLPATLKTIEMGCFCYCDQLRHISFPGSISLLPAGVVYGCSKLESLIIPEGVKSCGYWVASGKLNQSLKTVSLPASMESLSWTAQPSFVDFSHDIEFLSWARVAPSSGPDNFTGFTIHVPQGCAHNYKNKPAWTNATIIEDLLVGSNTYVEKETGDVLVYVPNQKGLSDRTTVQKYTVECYDQSKTDTGDPDFTFEFDGSGSPSGDSGARKVTARCLSTTTDDNTSEDWKVLRITGLPQNAKFLFDIKGHTSENHVIYNNTQEVNTSGYNGIADISGSEQISLFKNVLSIPKCFDSFRLTIHTLDGRCVLSEKIADCNRQFTLDLEHGVYVIKCSDTSLKIKL